LSIPVKICGITTLKDAELAVNYGASAVGFIFAKDSPRFIDINYAKNWINDIPKNIKKVGVFVDEQIENITKIVNDLQLDFIQLHGDESPQFCTQMIKPVVKVFRIKDDFNPIVLNNYKVAAFLFDTYKKGTSGGTGEKFNWELIENVKTGIPIILSGGLNALNILEGIKIVNPSAVDINSGVESSPGIKEEGKIKQIFNTLIDANGKNNFF